MTLNLNGLSVNGSLTFGLTKQTQTDPENLVDADYNNITLNSPDEGASRESATTGAMTMTLNSTGRGWINKTGWTKLSLKHLIPS